jgi:hypothetical protein
VTRGSLVRALACAWLVAVAGCSGIGAGTDRPDTATLTPASVPSDAPTDLAPGIGERRVTDRRTTTATHRSVLEATSYRLTYGRTIEGPNGTLDRIRLRTTAAPDRRRYVLTRTEVAAPAYVTPTAFARLDVWFGGGASRLRFTDADGESRYWGDDNPAEGGPISDPTRAERTVATLAAFEYRVVDERTVDGTRRYVLRGDRIVRPSLLDTAPTLEAPRNATLEATVTSVGVVRAYEVRYEARYRGRSVTVRTTHGLSAVGTATVPRPAWLSAANASVADDATPSG